MRLAASRARTALPSVSVPAKRRAPLHQVRDGKSRRPQVRQVKVRHGGHKQESCRTHQNNA